MASKVVILTLCSLVSLAFLSHSGNGQNCGPANGGSCGSACCSQFGYCGGSCDYCGAGCQGGYGRCGGCDCFPASAMVTTRSGLTKPISALSIGEEVTVRNHKGVVEYDSVYALGHADPDVVSEFIVLTLSSSQHQNVTQTLQLTPRHFTLVQGLDNKLEYKLASNVRLGDRMLANHDHHDPHFSTFVVSGIEKQTMRGLYKPLTLKGTIVVNNVLASCFSQWHLHSALEHIFGANALPSIYQAIFTPMRMAYTRMDKDVYTRIYSTLNPRSIASIVVKSRDNLKGSFELLMGDASSPLA